MGNDVRFGRVAARQAAMSRREDHRLHLRRHLHRPPAGQRMLEAHLGMIREAQRRPKQLQRPFVPVGVQVDDRTPERDRRRELSQDLRAALSAQICPARDDVELRQPRTDFPQAGSGLTMRHVDAVAGAPVAVISTSHNVKPLASEAKYRRENTSKSINAARTQGSQRLRFAVGLTVSSLSCAGNAAGGTQEPTMPSRCWIRASLS